MSTCIAEFNGHPFAIYRNTTPHSELKILAKLQLSVRNLYSHGQPPQANAITHIAT